MKRITLLLTILFCTEVYSQGVYSFLDSCILCCNEEKSTLSMCISGSNYEGAILNSDSLPIWRYDIGKLKDDKFWYPTKQDIEQFELLFPN